MNIESRKVARELRLLAEKLELQATENIKGGWSTNSNSCLTKAALILRDQARILERHIK